jgi:hypothetical protein
MCEKFYRNIFILGNDLDRNTMSAALFQYNCPHPEIKVALEPDVPVVDSTGKGL